MIHYITNREANPQQFWDTLPGILSNNISAVQLREKNISTREFITIAKRVQSILQPHNIPLIINDNLAVALAVNADGLHIGQDDCPPIVARRYLGPDKTIGLSIRSVEELQQALNEPVDYYGVGPIFPTQTKSDAKPPLGLAVLQQCVKMTDKPIIAIGGINNQNKDAIIHSGAQGVAMSSALQPSIQKSYKDTVVLSIAGSDSGGGAGIQADIKTLSALQCFATTAITAITAQNTRGVQVVEPLSPEITQAQLLSVLTDFSVSAIKIGLLGSNEIIELVADVLIRNPVAHVIVDPVMIAESGDVLLPKSAIHKLQEKLFPLATLITPNLPEASQCLSCVITTPDDIVAAAKQLSELYGTAVLIKGGHGTDTAVSNDYFYSAHHQRWYTQQRIQTLNTHGTGCSLSSAIAAFCARGYVLEDAIHHAKTYLTDALYAAKDQRLGQGAGPVQHFHHWWG